MKRLEQRKERKNILIGTIQTGYLKFGKVELEIGRTAAETKILVDGKPLNNVEAIWLKLDTKVHTHPKLTMQLHKGGLE